MPIPALWSSRADPGRVRGRKQAGWLIRAQAGAPGHHGDAALPAGPHHPRQGEGPGDGGWSRRGRPTLNTLIWQLAECKCSVYSPFSFCLKVSICTRKGTPFSPPCFLGVNSVLMQCTCRGRGGQVARSRRGWALDRPPPTGSSPDGGFHPARSDPPPPLRSPPVLSTRSGRRPPHPLTTEGMPSHLCPLTLEAPPDHLSPCRCSRPTDPGRPPHSCP